jgi:GNAT superfamily N-acetyltransferase
VTVSPELHGQGIGRALYDHLMRELIPFDPLSIRSHIREDMARGVRFLEDRGFVVDMRSWESRLDVASFDPSPYADTEARMEELGIEIKTLAELEHAPGHLQRHYELSQELIVDVPSTEPHTRVDKTLWQKRLYENPDLIREAFLIAVHGEEYVGVSILWNSQGSDDLYTGLTAIRRPYRRLGIALALKLRAIAWAKANHKPVIKTWNETNNRAMLGINERLGYVRQPTWLDYVKVLKEETE